MAESSSVPQVSVVMPVRNASKTIRMQLEALARQDFTEPWELIVADNGSSDGTAEIVSEWKRHFSRCRTIDASSRPGVNFARNRGAEAASSNRLLFCDADDVADESWISEMAKALEVHEFVGGLLDPRLLNAAHTVRWRGKRSVGGLPVALRFLPYVEGANLAIRRDLLETLGWWDEEFTTPGGDDVALSWRAQLAGRELGYAPEAVMHYRLREDLRSTLRQAFFYGQADVRLFVLFRDAGAPRSNIRGMASWVKVILKSYKLLLSRSARGEHLWAAAYRAGRLSGSIRHRTLFL